MLALGKVGKPFSGYGCITGQGNGQGGREHGQKADQLPGYRLIENTDHRAEIARIWNVDPAELPRKGKSAYELLDSLGPQGGIRALLVFGSNVAVASPNASNVARKLRALDLLVVCDAFENETTAAAHVVLPVAQWAEEEGTMTNLEGRVILRQRVRPPPPGVKTDLDVFCELARRLGVGDAFDLSLPERCVRRAARRDGRGEGGLQRDHLRADPPASAASSGRALTRTIPELRACSQDRFHRPDGRARFHPVRPSTGRRAARSRIPALLHDGALPGALQFGSADPSRRRVAGRPAPAEASDAPPPRGASGPRRGRRRGRREPARRGRVLRARLARHPRRHALRALSLGRPTRGQRPDDRGARPDEPHARVQGVRREGARFCGPEAAPRPCAGSSSRSSATGWALAACWTSSRCAGPRCGTRSPSSARRRGARTTGSCSGASSRARPRTPS